MMANKKEMNLTDLISDLQQGAIDGLLALAGIEANYTPESLDKVEETINYMYPEGHKPLHTTLIPFGFYLGETIVRNLTYATWDAEDAEYLDEVKVVVKTFNGQESVMYPFRRIEKFWHDRTDGLSAFYRMAHLLTSTDPKMLKDTNGGWITFPNGDKMRITKVEKDELH